MNSLEELSDAEHHGELFRALGALCESSNPAANERISDALGLGEPPSASDYTELFVFQLPPYASIYVGTEGMIGGEARDRISGFWRALGLSPPAEPDHLTTMLGMYARIVELQWSERDETVKQRWLRVRRAFLWEHLTSWLPCYLEKVHDLSGQFYASWSKILLSALISEHHSLERLTELPLHLRSAATSTNSLENELDVVLQMLLAPVRSGMILTRADLARAAREVGISLRAGERKFVLKTLLGQEAAEMLGWLSQEASSWVGRAKAREEVLRPVSDWWAQRAADTKIVLKEMRESIQ